jgi:nucleolar protein 12
VSKRKRKRTDADDDLEDAYMQKLEKEEARDAEKAAAERASKRQKPALAELGNAVEPDSDEDIEVDLDADSDIDEPKATDDDEDDEAATPPPKHETLQTADHEADKATRTVFLGNVSTTAITSKTARKALIKHLSSFFDKLPPTKDGQPKHKLDSIRFRSTAFSASIPKKAAFAKKDLMAATTQSTNAYAVYSSPLLSREAARRLNATVILDRHLRVDEIAHPAKIDHKRCVFVGNLHFVSDESNIQAANAEQGREHRKPAKEPADVEEGLWRTFSRHGAVESVRVIRDSATRVGKGIAYVQFANEISVEAALLDDEKKFPPMLPRKLRVSRAKAVKRNAKPGSGRPSASNASTPRAGSKVSADGKGKKSGYQRKITAEEASQIGRAGKLYGKAAAAAVTLKQKRPVSTGSNGEPVGTRGSAPRSAEVGKGIEGFKKPESFVFEGHRATAKQGTTGLRLGGKNKKGGSAGGKPKNRSAKRGASFKAGGSKRKSEK